MERRQTVSSMEFISLPATFALPKTKLNLGIPPCVFQIYILFFLLHLNSSWKYLSPFLSSTELPPYLEKIKQQANDAFARQQWTHAIQLYSLGIHKANHNAMLYGNRAAAYMKRKWYGEHATFRS